jgi:D-3-phosphoglycerate dehydrogenase
MTWRVLIPDGLASTGLSILQQEAEVVDSGLEVELGNVDALIVRSRTRVDRDVIERGRPRLKVVGRAGVGVDNIDLKAAEEQGVTVVYAPQSTSISVAEHTLALILAIARQLTQADASMRRGEWEKSGFVGHEVRGKTLGLIGIGRIGALVAERAAAFGMNVLAYDPGQSKQTISERGAESVPWDILLQRSDVISLHVPLTEGTANLIDRNALDQLKPGAWVICTSRGGIVDEEALLAALKSGKLGGAALDVFEHEPLQSSELREQPNLILTPHIAGQTYEAQARVAEDIAHEVLSVLRGETPRWRVI